MFSIEAFDDTQAYLWLFKAETAGKICPNYTNRRQQMFNDIRKRVQICEYFEPKS